MRIEIEFDTSNAAFSDYEVESAADFVQMVSTQIRDGHREGRLQDVNGNSVGTWTLTDCGY